MLATLVVKSGRLHLNHSPYRDQNYDGSKGESCIKLTLFARTFKHFYLSQQLIPFAFQEDFDLADSELPLFVLILQRDYHQHEVRSLHRNLFASLHCHCTG